MRVGIVAGSFKPLHCGHFNMIERASKECDDVMLFASLSDRGMVTGEKMKRVWDEHLTKILPSNVKLVLCSVPIAEVYKYLGRYDKLGTSDRTFYVYSDPQDINKNFSSVGLKKYLGHLFEGSHLVMVPVQRQGRFNVSGTQLRKHLQEGDQASFIRCLPDNVDGRAIWDILSGEEA